MNNPRETLKTTTSLALIKICQEFRGNITSKSGEKVNNKRIDQVRKDVFNTFNVENNLIDVNMMKQVGIGARAAKNNAFHYACDRGHWEIIEIFFEKNMNIDMTMVNNFNRTGLIVAIWKRHTRVVKVILEQLAKYERSAMAIVGSNHDGDVDSGVYNTDNDTTNSVSGKYGIGLKELINYSKGSDNALILACQQGEEDIVKLLLKYGADLNICMAGDAQWTPLMVACRYGQLGVVETLIDHLKNESNESKCKQYVNALASDETNALFIACIEITDNVEIVKLLCENGANIEIKDKNTQRTPILVCSDKNNIKCLKELYKYGANINNCDKEGWSSLHNACLHGKSIEMIECIKNQ